tara:strand:- start:933 stop:1847 length:915 start_codon:yes stop_codon:yes gene_type:complete
MKDQVNSEDEIGPLYGSKAREKNPIWDATGSEQVLGSTSNSYIVLGRDRNSSKASGKGGPGYTQCGKIDLVVGLNSAADPNTKKTNPSFFDDAARIYISQKSDVDRYFGLSEGSEVVSSVNKSSVGIKADHVRIVGRNHIKIVTGGARINGRETDAIGNELEAAGGIDLIAGNSTEEGFASTVYGFGPIKVPALQKLVKGENLQLMINDLIEVISEIQNQTFANKRAILSLATNYSSHIHFQSFPPGLPVSPSPMALGVIPTITEEFTNLPSSFIIETNLETLSQNYLELDSTLCIMSKTVRTT